MEANPNRPAHVRTAVETVERRALERGYGAELVARCTEVVVEAMKNDPMLLIAGAVDRAMQFGESELERDREARRAVKRAAAKMKRQLASELIDRFAAAVRDALSSDSKLSPD